MKISVIIPVYNTEKYLHECLDSVLAQSFTDFEVLLINDGSTDSSGRICDEYAQKDARVKVFHQKNGGVSAARNLGLDNAKGDWVCFVDSDDEILEDALQNYANTIDATNADIIISNYIVKYENGIENPVKIDLNASVLHNHDIIKKIIDGKIHGSLCNKIVKASILKTFRFDPDIIYMEDKLLLIKLLLQDPRVFFMNELTYVYIQRQNSATNQLSGKAIKSIRKVTDTLISYLDKDEFSTQIFKLKIDYKVRLLTNGNSSQKIKDVYSEINSDLVRSSTLPIHIKILFWFELRGIQVFSRLYRKMSN